MLAKNRHIILSAMFGTQSKEEALAKANLARDSKAAPGSHKVIAYARNAGSKTEQEDVLTRESS